MSVSLTTVSALESSSPSQWDRQFKNTCVITDIIMSVVLFNTKNAEEPQYPGNALELHPIS